MVAVPPTNPLPSTIYVVETAGENDYPRPGVSCDDLLVTSVSLLMQWPLQVQRLKSEQLRAHPAAPRLQALEHLQAHPIRLQILPPLKEPVQLVERKKPQ